MPKGYWIPHIDVSNPEAYKAYMAATPAAHEKYGGRALPSASSDWHDARPAAWYPGCTAAPS